MLRKEVDQNLFDEAVRVGNDCVRKANRYMRINRQLVEDAYQAMLLLDSGRTEKARERLAQALRTAERDLR